MKRLLFCVIAAGFIVATIDLGAPAFALGATAGTQTPAPPHAAAAPITPNDYRADASWLCRPAMPATSI